MEAIGAGNEVAQNKFWLGVNVCGVDVCAGVVSSGGSEFLDIFVWTF